MLSIIDSCPQIMYRLIRYSLYVFTLALSLFGLSLIVFSFWYLYEGNQYHLDTTTSFSVTAIVFITGVVLLGVSSCGLAGVLRENIFLSKLFLGSSLLMMLIELVSVILIYLYKKQILLNANMIFESFIVNYVDDDDVRTVVDTIQSNLQCCGITSVHDWEENVYYSCASISTLACSVPPSCCRNFKFNAIDNNFFCGVGVRNNNTVMEPSKRVYLNGCKFEIYSFFERRHTIIFTLFAASLVPQLMGLLCIICYIISLSWSKKTIPKLGVPNAIEFRAHGMKEINHISLFKPYEQINRQQKITNTKSDFFEPRLFNDIKYY